MAYQFYLTDGGRAAIAQALSGDPVKITTACFGKGGGVDDGVDYSIAELKSPVTEKTLDPNADTVTVDSQTGSVSITVELPTDYSGLMNEIGYKDEDGTLILYGVVPEENIAVDPDRSYRYTNWIVFENEEADHIEFSILTPDYERVEKLVERVEQEFDPSGYALKSEVKEVTNRVTVLEGQGADLEDLKERVATLETMIGTAVERLEAAL